MKLDGILNAAWATAAWPGRATLFADGQADLSAVQRIDSAGLALLVKWAKHRRAEGESLEVIGANSNFLKLATLYGVESLFCLKHP